MIWDILITLLIALAGCVVVLAVLAGSFLATVKWLCGDRRKSKGGNDGEA